MAKQSTLANWSQQLKERVQGTMIPTLETDRLRLRPPTKADLHDNYELSSDPEVMRYITPGRTQSIKESREDLYKRIKFSRGSYGYWVVEEKQSGCFIGWIVLKELDHTKDFELGFRFQKNQWGRGFATEAGKKILVYAFEVLQLDLVKAVVMPKNDASRKVLEKIGFQLISFGRYYNAHCAVYQIGRSDLNEN
ncbi:MAG: GNAT family N-acetyltransferase [Saprospiraceae bacterium]